MNRNHLIQLLMKELRPSVNLTPWMLEDKVTEAVDAAMVGCEALQELIDRLYSGVVIFSYLKTDGSVRDAIRTLKPSLLDMLRATVEPKSGQRRSKRSDIVMYYDLKSEDWRCFRCENFISMK